MAFNPQEHMMDLKGKQYLQVMWRLVWFREEHPDWSINTKMVCWDKDTQTAVFQAEIADDGGRILSTGYGSEAVKDFKDYIEKAETKAVGRALAMLGYGTQFAPDLDEGERIVDSPVQAKPRKFANANKTEEKISKRVAAAKEWSAKGIDTPFVLKLYGCTDLAEMTDKQIENALKNLDKIKEKQEAEA